ncbi:MAG: hypothetical protein KDA24_22230 [Deltaproteobacteria bacterium]|nr:hypothetical protein [Deltaproteobacteria bacterium]
MAPKTLLVAAAVSLTLSAGFVVVLTTFFAASRLSMAFALPAIMGTYAAAVLRARTPDAVDTRTARLSLGGVLALCAMVEVWVTHQVLPEAIAFVDVTMPISVVGSFVMPMVLFSSFFKNAKKALASKR